MKKVITICLLVVSLFLGGMTMESKTTKKKSKALNSSSAIIGKIIVDEWNTYNLLANGKLTKDRVPEITGSYQKLNDEKCYRVEKKIGTSGDYDSSIFLIVDNNAYIIVNNGGEGKINQFSYDRKNNLVTIINDSGSSDEDFMEWNDLHSLTMPLSHFEKFATVKWIK